MEMAFRLSRNKVMDVQFSEVDLLALFDVLLRNFPYQPAMEIEEARLFVDYVNDITQVAIAKGWKQKSFRHALDKRASQLNGAAKDLLHEVGNQWDTKGNLPPDLQADRVTQQLFERIPRFPK